MALVVADKVQGVGHRAVKMMGKARYLEARHRTPLVVPHIAWAAVDSQESLPAKISLA